MDPAYFADEPAAAKARAWLKRNQLLADAQGAQDALNALAGRDPSEPVYVNDDDLLAVRAALLALPSSEREEVGRQIGDVLLVDGYRWERDERVATKVAPAHAYLPTEISRDTRGWGQAAGRTEGILWIDGRYDGVLRRGAAEGTRARAFFRLLGAEVAPRLEDPAPSASEFKYGMRAAWFRSEASPVQRGSARPRARDAPVE